MASTASSPDPLPPNGRMTRHSSASRWRAEMRESFFMAMGALASHKLRSALTLLGVMIGVFSIIVVMTAIRVLQSNIESELSQLGAHTFSVQKMPPIHVKDRDSMERMWRRPNITWQHVQLLRDKATLATSVAAETYLWRDSVISRHSETEPNVLMMGVSPESFVAKSWNVERGRALLASDLDSARSVCVLGASLKKKIFPFSSGLSEKVKFRGINYTVVGVLEERGQSMGGDQDNFLAVPLTTGLNRFGSHWRSLSILVQAPSAALLDDTMEQVRGALRVIRKVSPTAEDDFEMFTNDSLITQFRSITLAVRLGASIISGIALLAAGIGIMNIMLVSVTERTREIGIRRAVGARKRNILIQFIMESVVICQVGGVLGVVMGILGGNVAAWLLGVTPVIPLDWVALGLFICCLVGVVFGTYPAIKAANLDPIDSLRFE